MKLPLKQFSMDRKRARNPNTYWNFLYDKQFRLAGKEELQ